MDPGLTPPRDQAALQLRAERLTRHFTFGGGLMARGAGTVRALSEVDFELTAGQTLAIVGESGCGKSTLARLVLNLDRPTAGRVLLNGEDIHAARGRALRRFRRQVQAVFQDPWASLNPRMRVRDLVAEPLDMQHRLPRSEREERVAQVLQRVGIDPARMHAYPHEFSGGQRQRIAIASALISDPKLIVLDEPVSALDVSIRSQVMNLFRDLQEERGIAFLLIAHDLATTAFLAHRIAVMYLGRIVELGPTEQMVAAPAHPYTRSLFGAALPAHPDAGPGAPPLSGEIPSPLAQPPGCAFHTRCPARIGPVCDTQRPVPTKVGAGWSVECHLHAGTEP